MRFFGAVAIICAVMGASAANAAVLDIKTVSGSPDRVSGNDTLVAITSSDDAAVPVMLNGADVSQDFRAGAAPHSRMGLVSGLKLGVNSLTAGGKTLKITNYPITGPIVSAKDYQVSFTPDQMARQAGLKGRGTLRQFSGVRRTTLVRSRPSFSLEPF
jgi:hypothetical protein